jgi:transposase
MGMRGRSIWSGAGWLGCVRVWSAQRSGRGIARRRVVQLIGGRCRLGLASWGVERRVYALIASLPFSCAQTAHFSFDMTLESFLEGHVRVFDWLGGVPRDCVYDNLRSVVAKRDCRQVVRWNQRFLHLRGHYAFHSTVCTPATPREKGSVEGAVRYLKSGFWPARRFATLSELDRVYADCCAGRHARLPRRIG